MPLLRSTCNTVHCLGERAFFSPLFEVVLSLFPPSNAPTTPYNIRNWWFFLSQGNPWIKYRAHPKIRRPKLYQRTFSYSLAEPVERTVREYSDRSLTIGGMRRNYFCLTSDNSQSWRWRRSANGELLHCLQWQVHDVFLVFIAEK